MKEEFDTVDPVETVDRVEEKIDMALVRVFATSLGAETHLLTLGVGAQFLRKEPAFTCSNPGNAYNRITSRGVKTLAPCAVVELGPNQFVVPVPAIVDPLLGIWAPITDALSVDITLPSETLPPKTLTADETRK